MTDTRSGAPPDGDLPSPVVGSEELAHWLAGERPPGWEGAPLVLVDVRWYLDGRDGHAAFTEGHLPGARWVDLERDLAGHGLPPTEGRHPLPNPPDFASAMAALGIGDGTLVVAYDDSGGSTAGRLVVMLRWLGHPAVLLDGGLLGWDGPLEHGEPPPAAPARFSERPWPADRLADADEVAVAALDPDQLVLDARAHERFTGAVAVVDPRAGHVPGARSAPWADNLDPRTGRLRPPDELAEHYEALGVGEADDVIVHCGSGVSACLDLLAMEHAGLGPARLYVGSWSGWSSDPGRPVELGDVDDGRAATDPSTVGLDALRDLRTTRRRHRLEELEWFEALYRVYLAAIVGGGTVLFLSGLVADDELDPLGALDVASHGPRLVGLLAALALALGLRSGVNGGPLAIEQPDAVHVLLAPLPRDSVLRVPALQRLRSAAFAGALFGAVAGQLASRRLPGDLAEWALWGALAGATAATLFVVAALIAHSTRLPRPAATALGALVLGWQLAVVATSGSVPGPGDPLGRLATWPLDASPADLLAVVVIAASVPVAVALVGRTSIEAMVRRSGLVAQLRFAVTVQDLRTVVLLRRQLSQEHPRSQPWCAVPLGRRFPVWARSWRGLARFPARRLLRMGALVGAASWLLVIAHRGTTPALVAAALLLFLVGLEVTEPLAQALDQPDLTGSFVRHSGRLHLAHLTAPLVMLAPLALVGSAVAIALEPSTATALVAAALSLPLLVATSAGAVVNVVKGAPDPLASSERSMLVPPEVSGFGTLVRTALPPAVSVMGTLPLLLVRFAHERGEPLGPVTAQAVVLMLLVAGAVSLWVLRRDDLRRRWREMMAQADAARAAPR